MMGPLANRTRIADRIVAIAKFNDAPELGGTTRLAYTSTCRDALELVAQWMESCGMTSWMDAAGNLIGRLGDADSSGKPLAIGSHIDTVANGGNYDGVLGVVAGLEVAAFIAENEISIDRPLEIIVFNEEEGALFGSRAVAGQVGEEDLLLEVRGVSKRDALRAFGGDPAGLLAGYAERKNGFSAYLEVHIEQGPVLADADVPLGAVEGIVGFLCADVAFRGETNHAGATPMESRHDALLGACELALEVERLCNLPDYAARGTVGVMNVHSGCLNAVPGHVSMTLDIRDLDESVRDATCEAIVEAGEKSAKKRGLTVETNVYLKAPPALCDEEIIRLIEKHSAYLGYKSARLASGAGHDAQSMARICPMGMIFVRSTGGSHNPAEFAAPDDIAAGADVLILTALDLLGS